MVAWCYHCAMTGAAGFTDQMVIAAVRAVGVSRALWVHPRCQDTMERLDITQEGVCDAFSTVSIDLLEYHEPGDQGRPTHVAVFNMYVPPERLLLYVKVALQLPDLARGTLLSIWLK
jgi:hypothetical protein